MNVENYISINYKLRDFPTIGATFITTSGLFVDLNERGYDFSAFVNDLRKQNFCFGMKTERIRALEMKGWIRCNDGTKDGNAYIELYRHTPTAEQKLAMYKWLTNIQTSKKCLTISFIGKRLFEERKFDSVNPSEVLEYIDFIYRKTDFSPNFKSVVLEEHKNGLDWYKCVDKNNHKHSVTYHLGDDKIYDGLKPQSITTEVQAMFISAHDEFMKKIHSAMSGKDDYITTKLLSADIAYRKNKNGGRGYDFVVKATNVVYFETNTIDYFIFRFSLNAFNDANEARKKITESILQGDAPLLQSAYENNDLYLATSLKAYVGILTKEERDYLYKVDKIAYFDCSVEFLDIDDIADLNVKQGHYSMFRRRVNYHILFAYDNKIHTATWYPSDQMFKKNYCALCNDLDNKILVTIGHGCSKYITIGERLKEEITKKALILEGKA